MQAAAELSTPPLSGKRNPPLTDAARGEKKHCQEAQKSVSSALIM